MRHPNNLPMLQRVDIEARALEILPSVDEPLDGRDDEDDEEGYYAVVCANVLVGGAGF